MYGKLLKYILLLILMSFPLQEAWAEEPLSLGLGVSPQVFDLDVFPGETITKKINLRNKSQVALPIAVKVTDFTAAEETGEMLFDEALQDPSIASWKWFKIENPNFILDFEETEIVNFTIEIPENAELGGHYSVMLFEPQLPSFYFEEGQPRAIPVIGVLFLFSVKTFALEPEIQQKLEIVEFSLPEEERLIVFENLASKLVGSVAQAARIDINIVENSPSKFILGIKNNDIYHHKPGGKLLIYNTFGKKVGETEISHQTILPGKTRQFPVEFSPEIPERLKWLPASISNFLFQNTSFGKYKATLILGTSDQKLEAETQFWAFPWKVIVPLILLIIGLILLRKRIFAATKALLGVKY
jgi:hypothetical protein